MFAEDKAVGNKRWRSYTILEVQVCIIIEITVLVLNTKSTTLSTREQQNCLILVYATVTFKLLWSAFHLEENSWKTTLKIFHLRHKILFFQFLETL